MAVTIPKRKAKFVCIHPSAYRRADHIPSKRSKKR